jgi:hypothetical protein
MKYLILFLILTTACVNEQSKPYSPQDSRCGGYIVMRDADVVLTDSEIAEKKKACEDKGQCLEYITKFSDGRIDYTCRIDISHDHQFQRK